jgi:hypothetical protein
MPEEKHPEMTGKPWIDFFSMPKKYFFIIPGQGIGWSLRVLFPQSLPMF